MNTTQKYMLETYMKPLYDAEPEGALLESIRSLEARLTEYAGSNPASMDMVGDSGLRDEYNSLYMAAINRNNGYSSLSSDKPEAFDYSKEQRLPTVHEFLDSYRYVYETSIKPNGRELTDRAYQKLFEVEQRTDDLIEAQMIIERENLIVNTVTADYRAIAEDFLEAADPNYEVTSAGIKNTIGVYANARSLDEITYMGEYAKTVCDDLAVQTKLRVEMMINLTALVFGWERAKRKLREGDGAAAEYAKAMVVNRSRMKKYYRFLTEDMGIDFETIKQTPFYRILLLNPQGLDELWRIKKVMHFDNIRAIEYVLFEEMLTDKSIGEILMTPQPYPYYEMTDSNQYLEIDEEYARIAETLNKEFKYFQRNRAAAGKDISQYDLIDKTRNMTLDMAASGSAPESRQSGIAAGGKEASGNIRTGFAQNAAKSAARELGKGLLRGLFRR